MKKVVFVCLGNICRSPAAEAVFLKLLEEQKLSQNFLVESRGTSSHHQGERPDPRMLRALKKRNIEVHSLSSLLSEKDLLNFDYVICMDRSNLKNVLNYENAKNHKNIFLYSDLIPQYSYTDVPDPYYGEAKDFDLVIDIVNELGLTLLKKLSA